MVASLATFLEDEPGLDVPDEDSPNVLKFPKSSFPFLAISLF